MDKCDELLRVISFLTRRLEALEKYVEMTDPLIEGKYIEVDKIREGINALSFDPGYDAALMGRVFGVKHNFIP